MARKPKFDKFKSLYEEIYGRFPSDREIWEAPEELIQTWLGQMTTCALATGYDPCVNHFENWSYQKVVRHSYELKKKARLVK